MPARTGSDRESTQRSAREGVDCSIPLGRNHVATNPLSIHGASDAAGLDPDRHGRPGPKPALRRDPDQHQPVSSGLTCSGKAAGLGNGPTAAFLTAGSVSATYVCHNHGGQVAPDGRSSTRTPTGTTADPGWPARLLPATRAAWS